MNIIQELHASLEKFCEQKILPNIESEEEKEELSLKTFNELGELGFCGITTDEKFGGLSLGYTELCNVLEGLAKYSVSYAVTVSVSSMVQSILTQFGNDDQKLKYLPDLASGKKIGAFSLSESESGSDAAALKTTASKTEGGYIINGTKMWVTSGGLAETYIVMARTSENGAKGVSAFIVTKDMKGFSFGKKEKKMGWKASPTRELIFENCFVPTENLLSNEGNGFSIAMSALDRGRITIGAIGLGLAQTALDYACKYSLERQQFKKPIFEFQGLQFILADDATEIEASRALVYKASENYDKKTPNVKLAAMAKMKATDTAMRVTTNAVQVLGGVGYTQEFPVERYMRDAKVLQIVEGTNQIQKIVIARELKKENS